MPMFDSVDGDPGYQSSFERFVSRQPVKTYSKRRPFGRTPSKNVEPILERLERLSPKKSKDVAEDENVLNERRQSVPVPRYGPPISPPLADKFKSIILESEKEARTIDDEKSVLDCSRRRSSRTAKQRSSTDSVFDSFACMADKSESESIAGSEKMAAPKNDIAIESSQDSGFGSQDSRESEAKIIKLLYVPKSIGKTVDANFNSKNGLRRSTRPKSSTSSEDDNLPLAALAAKNGIRRKSGGKVSISEPEYVVGDSSRDGMNLHDLIQARAKEIFTTLEMVERRSSPRKATETKILSFVPAVSPAKDASVLTDKIETVAEPESTKTDILQKTEEVIVAAAKDLPTNNDNAQKTNGSSASHLRSIQLKNKRKTPPKTQKSGTENASPPKSPRNKLKYKRLLNFLPFKEKLKRLRIAEAEAAERRAALALKNAAKSAGDIAQESCPDSGKAKPVKPKVTAAAASMPKPKPAKAPKRKLDGSSCDLPKNKRRKTESVSSAPVLTQASKELEITNYESNKVTMTITATSITDELKSEKSDVSTSLEIITSPEKLGEIDSPAVSPNGTRRKHTTPKKLTDYDCRRRSRSSLGASYDAEEKSKPKPKVKKEGDGNKRYSGFYTDGEPYNIMYRLIKIRNSMSRDELDLNQNDKKSS